jgi:hypothetical protein
VATALRGGRWSYAAVNAAHILGIALLYGAITPLNLRLLGLWGGVPREPLARVLVPVAAAGLALAVAAGLLLFATRATEYAGTGFFQAKLALVALGAAGALLLHRTHGLVLHDAPDSVLRRHAILSLACWTGAILCGRLIAFAD